MMDAWAVAKKLDRLLELEERQGKAIASLQDQIDTLAQRMIRIESREEIVVAKAEAAAGMAAMGAATLSMADLARRIGGLEERSRGSDQAPRLT